MGALEAILISARLDAVTPPREHYTPGWTDAATAMMAQRRLETHGRFFLPHLRPGQSMVDIGCGPGTITIGLAEIVAPGLVVGIDAGADQLELARALAQRTRRSNVRFDSASAYELPLPDGSVDRVFSHALLEHLSDPVAALGEARRVLRPGGMIGVCCPDWAGFLIAPSSPEVAAALSAYQDLQRGNGGDPRAGHKLGAHLTDAGFTDVWVDARYERFPNPQPLAELLAEMLENAGRAEHANELRTWSQHNPGAMFAEAWVSAVASLPA